MEIAISRIMTNKDWKRYGLYLIRWQMSSVILAPVIGIMKGTSIIGTWSDWSAAIVANLIGGAIFFWVDRIIFKGRKKTQ